MNIASQQDFAELDLNTRVSDLVRRSAVTCAPETTLEKVFKVMDQSSAGSIVVVKVGRLEGILTRYDLIRRILVPKVDQSTPISEVMSRGVHFVQADTLVIDAMLIMARLGIRHLPVLRDGHMIGMVSERDLVAYQRTSLRGLSVTIARAKRLEDLKQASKRVIDMAQRMLSQGLGATSLARMVSHLNDAMTRRVIEIIEEKHEGNHAEPLPPWVWLALGSEGREEQTVATDQDNAIIFAGDGDLYRDRFMAFAERINKGLAEIGFPLCKGGVMAMNAKWCRNRVEWREEITSWFEKPTPEAVLDSHTFLDFRPLAGDVGLADDLRKWVLTEMPKHPRFMRAVAEDSLRNSVNQLPKLFWLTGIARWLRKRGLEVEWMSPKEIDIKKWGTAPVVAWARALGQAIGTKALSTDGRIAALFEAGKLQRSEVQRYREAFDLVQRFRLRAQLTSVGQDNVLNLDALSLHDVEKLTDALATLTHLRQSVGLSFRI